MAEIGSLPEAVGELVHDVEEVALEGLERLIPTAAAREIVRQDLDLVLVRMTPGMIQDQMIGTGRATKLIFSRGGNPDVGSLHRLRDAVENGYPRFPEIDEHSHAGTAGRYVAGASNLTGGI